MTFPGDGDGSLEELLRNALHGEADLVSPSGDGLSRIQQRVDTRRQRQWWSRPLLALGSVTLVAAAGVGAYIVAAHPSQKDSLLTKPGDVVPTAAQTSPAPTPSPSESAPLAAPFPAAAFYPFTSAAAESSWEAQGGPVAQPWIVEPVALAKKFVAGFGGATDVTTVVRSHRSGSSATVTLGRNLTDGSQSRSVPVTVVRLQRYGRAWLVLGADDPAKFLRVSSPAAAASVTSPVKVSGPAYGVDESVQVDVRTIGELILGQQSLPDATGHVSFGNGSPPWSATLSFTTPGDARGAIVLTSFSAADGGTGKLVVSPVQFAANADTGYPPYFYAVKNGRVAKFATRNGAAISYLTKSSWGTASDPRLFRDHVYYLAGGSLSGSLPACDNAIYSVGTDGTQHALVARADTGYEITGYTLGFNLAIYERACLSATTPAGKLVLKMSANDPPGPPSNTVTFSSLPPDLVADPSWADGRHLAAIVRTGTKSSVREFDTWTAKSSGDANAACTGFDAGFGEPLAMQVDSSGNLWMAARTGNAIDVVRCVGPTPRVMFSIAGNRQPADIAVAGSGGAVLVTDTSGDVWRWSQGGDVVQLTPSVLITQLTW